MQRGAPNAFRGACDDGGTARGFWRFGSPLNPQLAGSATLVGTPRGEGAADARSPSSPPRAGCSPVFPRVGSSSGFGGSEATAGGALLTPGGVGAGWEAAGLHPNPGAFWSRGLHQQLAICSVGRLLRRRSCALQNC